MEKRISIATAVLTVLAAVLALVLVASAPAFAHHRDEHAKGKASSESSKSSNEGSDHDGDADSDDSTALEDGHEAEEESADGTNDNAHPSGKDRSAENGGSGNQGKAESNPDDSKGPMRSEGVAGEDDKANAGGGTDGDDQDGNNGCGNDDDFDDDNNGWCGKNKPTSGDEVQSDRDEKGPCDADASMAGVQPCDEEDDVDEDDVVLGDFEVRPIPDVPTVLGVRLSRAPVAAAAVRNARVRAGVLPFTGASLLPILLLGLGFMASGILAIRSTRR